MNKISFVNGSEPALNANNLNLMQTNAENAINAVANSIGNGTLTIQKNGSNVASFGANASSNVTANITVPTNNNELTNGRGFVTSTDVSSAITTALNNKIKYGTSLPTTADNGTVFLLYS